MLLKKRKTKRNNFFSKKYRSLANVAGRLIMVIFLFLFVFFSVAPDILASTTIGTIDSQYKYAWGENIGWINFGSDSGSVTVEDGGLSGYALSETIGWIYLGDVLNDGEGNLSGYGWSENTGWINFAPDNGGVVIGSDGLFSGYALSETVGWIYFGGDYAVKTDWRPKSVRPQCNNSIDDDGDGLIDYPDDPGCESLDDDNETDPSSGGGSPMPVSAFMPPTAPPGGFEFTISPAQTSDKNVKLRFSAGSDARSIAISESSDFIPYKRVNYSSSVDWVLSDGLGVKTLYVKIYTAYGHSSEILSAKTQLITPPKEEKTDKTVAETEDKTETEKDIKKDDESEEILIPDKTRDEFEESVDQSIKKPDETSEYAPLPKSDIDLSQKNVESDKTKPISGDMFLFDFSKVGSMFETLAEKMNELAAKAPSFKDALVKLGLDSENNLDSFKGKKFSVPSLAELGDFKKDDFDPSQQVYDFARISDAIKENIPKEIFYVKSYSAGVDLPTELAVGEDVEVKQILNTVAGKSIELAIKPSAKAKSIKGYLVLADSFYGLIPIDVGDNNKISLRDLIFKSALAQEKDESAERQIEERFVLSKFEYKDDDNDGIYTAKVEMPAVAGRYEIITVVEYEDVSLGVKDLRLITVVDPEGYIYRQDGNEEVRIKNAKVSIYRFDNEAGKFSLWQADKYSQKNPQLTASTGDYSFLVPPGRYYLEVEAKGYKKYVGEPFLVQEGAGVHQNIEMKQDFLKKFVYKWEFFVFLLVFILLGYNFYNDRVRKRIK